MKHKGFTIVELLVVIIVIGILASIVIVSYGYLQADSKDSNIKSTVKVVGDAIQLHENQQGTRIATNGFFNASGSVDTLVSQGYLKEGYRDKLNSKNVSSDSNIFKWYNCPAAQGGFAIYASLNNPATEEVSNVNAVKTKCGHSNSQVPVSGTNKYNYAALF